MNKTILINSTLVTVLASVTIVSVAWLTLPYLQAPIQAATCDMGNVPNSINPYYGRPLAMCNNGPPNELFFHLSGGLIIGAFALAMFYLSFRKGWKIGIISSLSVASYQISEAFLETYRWYLFYGTGFFGFLLIFIITGIVFFLSTKYFLSYKKNKTANLEFPAILALLSGTVLASFVFLWIWKDNGISLATIGISSGTILLLLNHRYVKKKDQMPKQHNFENYTLNG